VAVSRLSFALVRAIPFATFRPRRGLHSAVIPQIMKIAVSSKSKLRMLWKLGTSVSHKSYVFEIVAANFHPGLIIL
jgi:hypothetical protein